MSEPRAEGKRRRLRTAAIVAGCVLAGVLLLVAVAVFVLTQTNWGRERVRDYAVNTLNARANGTVSIGEASGNLLTGITLDDFTIVDSAGAPFVRAERISAKYSLRGLLSSRIVLSDVELVRPEIVLDRRPGENWNFVRIFPTDTAAKTPGQTGLGSWILLNDVAILDGHLRVRNAWSPPDSLDSSTRAAQIERALAGDSRLRIEAVPGGYQSVMDLRSLSAWLPRLRLADPDSTDILAHVDSLRAHMEIFRPRMGEVRNLAGVFAFGDDSIRFADARLELPATEVLAEGAYALDGGLRATARAPALAFEDLLWLVPELPERGGGSFTADVHRTAGAVDVDASALDFRVDGSQIAGRLGVTLGDTIMLRDTDLRLTSVDTRLIEELAPSLELPRHGTTDGRIRLAGSPSALRLDADLAFVEPQSGRSSVRATGEVGTGENVQLRGVRVALDPVRMDLLRAFAPTLPAGGTLRGSATLDGTYPGRLAVEGDLTHENVASGRSRVLIDGGVRTGSVVAFDGLALRFDPLQVALARSFSPDLPVGGVVHGTAVLNGTTRNIIARGDLVHTEQGERSHVVGNARIAGGNITADVELLPVSLVTVGRFAPAAGLHGSAAGGLYLRANAREITASGQLVVADTSRIRLDAWLDRSATRYDVSALLATFDGAAVTTRSPATSLTGAVAVRGAGFDPATMTAEVRAQLTGPAVAIAAADGNGEGSPPLRADSVLLNASVAGGFATVEQAHVRLASARLDASGMFGLTEHTEGSLIYTLRVDSLSDFARYVPPDTTQPLPPRPALRAEAIARARADSLRFARATEVERMVTGRPALPPLQVDSVRPIRRDSLAGAIEAHGMLQGNVSRLSAEGSARLDGVVAFGNAVESGDISYSAENALTPAARYDVMAGLASVYARGFAFDTVTATVHYRGDFEEGDRGGTVDVRAVQDARRDYRVFADVVLALDRSLIRLDSLQLRFDTTVWRSTRPSRLAWGERGIEVDSLELANEAGGLIAADGRLPRSGDATVDVVMRNVQVGDIATLLQFDSSATGLLTLDARVRGRADSPHITSQFALTRASLGDRVLPDVVGDASYADARATASARAMVSLADTARNAQTGRTLLEANGAAPVRFSLQPFAFERLDGELEVVARADSLALDALPSFTTAVSDVRGRVVGDFALAGTWDDPEMSGRIDLDLGTFRVVPLGVTFTDVGGALRLEGGQAIIDSLVAHSRGTVRLDGSIEVAALDSPVFDLQLTADGARLLDNERGRITTDADIAARGPIDRVDVTGTVGVQSGVIYIPEPQKKLVPLDDPAVAEVADTAAPSTRELLPARNPVLDNLRVNVNVTVARDTWVRNTDANVEVYTPADEGALRVVLDQAAGSLSLQGRLNMDRGEYTAFGRRFVLTRGGVTFQGGDVIDPLLHIIARHPVQLPSREAIDINVHVGGSLSAPTLSLDSDAQPPISQTDLLSYLAFGRSSTSLFQQQASSLSGQSSGSGDLAGGVASLATRQLAGVAVDAVVDEFESGAARELGADVFRITPADLPAELSFGGFETVLLGTEVEVGKYFARRWFVAGQARPTFVRPGARLEYVTPRGFRWSLSYEPRFLPREPSFETTAEDPRTRGVLGMFLRWERRF